ncbi:MAG: deoxyribose-phosphate aldolase [Sphaerochaetaceae bacterium]|jgi:deoxyribose-phosphate aldolase|nr:deoxyribose-phosphate aldolase [Sphaerochaetaceae bacterium]NLY06939.1 deoxyribose-phosphate aldolase [Spirochaetales bacterium]
MKINEIARHIDYTQLKAFATWDDIKALCDEAIAHETASVCIPPSYVRPVHQAYGDKIRICTVIGFPLGYNTTETKVFEARKTIEEGAEEVDMVVNIGDVKMHHWDKITDEIAAIRKASKGKILKVIVETCYDTDEEKVQLCRCVTEGGADYIKTSTGFGTAGAALEDIKLFVSNIGPDVKIKAAGGIRTKADMEAFLDAGCDRIGASAKFDSLKD